ncbi:hypothetical protein [Nonomuraea sp. NPDC049158]|uniref:hypothetical protein n=1 Tax=Nonomuraea sp. NPDC049158 TaxID=3155649 RepID=UPI0033F6CFED
MAIRVRLHVLDRGRLVVSGSPKEVITPELLDAVFGVKAAIVAHPLTGGVLIAADHLA